MASPQVDASPGEDMINLTEATTNEPQVVAPPQPPEKVETVDLEDDVDLEAPAYQEKVDNSDNEEEKDTVYSPFIESEDAPPFRHDAGEPASFGDFNEDDDAEDEYDAVN